MDWLQKMNGAIDYIEKHLIDDLDYEEVAKIACCSVYHFQRMFSFIVDIPLSEYVRRRRLTLAALEIQNSPIKIIDLAIKYGYDSPDAFTRAFKQIHGVTPTLARNMGVELKAYPRLSFHISIKGDVEMNYRIEDKESYKVFGKSITIGLNDNPYEVIPKLWNDLRVDGSYEELCEIAGFEPYKNTFLESTLYDFDDDTYKNKYMINTLLPPKTHVPKEFDVLTIPAAKWVVFSDSYERIEDTTEVIQKIWKRIFTEWFPTSDYEVAEGPQLEVYPKGSVEVWIPIIEK
ncbi:AraC family transcriptional regulator [Vallitalea okinawensis]|uniref:AraC family transcriptional regulator n=1 Tax=Vallitalea okinawensis TaxID=2078660 RepID=UPI000CFD510F|nr:AraC family transcriptional regulator [Vallitalea okinawensis]